jgi:hypothetical protein
MKTLRFQDRGRATTDPRWDCGKSLWSERPRIAACSNPLQVRIARLNGKGGSVTRRAVYSFLRSSCLTSAARRGGWELRADD